MAVVRTHPMRHLYQQQFNNTELTIKHKEFPEKIPENFTKLPRGAQTTDGSGQVTMSRLTVTAAPPEREAALLLFGCSRAGQTVMWTSTVLNALSPADSAGRVRENQQGKAAWFGVRI